MFERGKIILVPFPFTNLSAQKVRPALIISKTVTADVIVLFISSKVDKPNQSAGVQLTQTDRNFSQTGLKVSSCIRCDKIATLDKRIGLGEIGKLSPILMKKVETQLKYTLGLKA